MIAPDDRLWQRLQGVPFDLPEARLDFTDRLARENGWTRRFAERAVEEYRRFALLAVTAAHEVTPSDEVDQVWHLHLTYSRHYWGVWTDALGRKLHHGPTIGGPEEAERYLTNYLATLESYYQMFGQEPPIDLWPDPRQRFKTTPRMRRVHLGRYFLVSKPAIAKLIFLAAMAFAALYLAGAHAEAAGEWARTSYMGSLLNWADDLGFLLCAGFLMFGTAQLLGVALSGLWRRVRGPRRRRRRDGTWSFVMDVGGDGDGDGGCGGCG